MHKLMLRIFGGLGFQTVEYDDFGCAVHVDFGCAVHVLLSYLAQKQMTQKACSAFEPAREPFLSGSLRRPRLS